ncbi:hypothetical protein GGG16DRAFT_126716 [Schizophyllum commune]
MIARCRSKCWILQLKEENQDIVLPTTQRGMKGHIIIYPQRPSEVAKLLPPALEDIQSPICVLFIGSTLPTAEWLRKHAKPLTVRPGKVRAALRWLKANNKLYEDIVINEQVLESMDSPEHILNVHIECVPPSEATETRTARYDTIGSDELQRKPDGFEIPWENVVIADIDGSASTTDLRAAALRHLKQRGGGYVSIPHDPQPVDEFGSPDLFPMIYPTLFPYGIGGFNDPNRSTPLSMARHRSTSFSGTRFSYIRT